MIITVFISSTMGHYFGADPTVFKDIGLAMNAIKARQRADRLRSLLEQRDTYTERLADAEKQLQTSYRRIEGFLTEIGQEFSRRVTNMARTGNYSVIVDAIRVRHYEEKGRAKKEISVIKHRLGSLNGLSVINKDQFVKMSIAIQNIQQAFIAASNIDSMTRSTQTALVTRLDECEPVLKRAVNIEENVKRFFDNSKILFCFLTGERGERSKLARLAMHQAGIEGGRDQAKDWLAAQEQALVRQLGVESIRIGS